MDHKRNSALLAAVLAALFLFNPLYVTAIAPPASIGPVTDSGKPPLGTAADSPEPGADTAATWDELALWMTKHQNDGGTVRLSADIVCDTDNPDFVFKSATTLDLGEYSLTVSGGLVLFSPFLTIKAKGGPDASLRVLPGGYFILTAHAVEPGSDGPAIWQEEGSILVVDLLLEDTGVHYAAQPVASVDEPIMALVPSGQTAHEALPNTIAAEVVFQGSARTGERLPVVWDTSGEDVADAIGDRRRVKIPGCFEGVLTFRPLECTLAFLDQPLTFTDATVQRGRQYILINAGFARPALPITVEVEYSFDKEYWLTVEADIQHSKDASAFMLLFCDPAVAEEDDISWDTAQEPLLYLRLRWLDAQNEDEAYSDVLTIDGDTLEIGSDIGGNRGGGLGLGKPQLPSITDSDDGAPKDTGTEALPDSPDLPDAASNMEAPKNEAPAATASEAPQVYTAAGPARSQESLAAPHLEVQAVADEGASCVPSEPPSRQAKSFVGILATGGIIILTMTWRHWGKRLLRILRK